MPYPIGIIGSGRLGSAIGRALYQKGWSVSHIVNRSHGKGQELADAIQSSFYKKIPVDTADWPDVWLVAVNDDSINDVVKEIGSIDKETLVFHTSGSVPAVALQEFVPNTGVIYPVQTFSDEHMPALEEVPFCIYAPNPSSLEKAKEISAALSNHHFIISDNDRAYIHLAAVYVNNFTNAICGMAKEIMDSKELPFELLLPLLRETVKKLEIMEPVNAQTGPAVRNDIKTLERHRQLLENYPQINSEIYHLLTRYIQSHIT